MFALSVANLGPYPDLAVDVATDHVFIGGASNADFTATGIIEVDASGQAVDIHAAGAALSGVDGLAVRSSTGRIYASDPFGSRGLIVDDVSDPVATIDAVSDVGATGAMFHGAVNPQGPPNANYRFEYSTDGASWTCVPDPGCASASDVSVGDGVSAIPVSQAVADLEPNTAYRVRLVANKDFNAAGAMSEEVTFTTDTAPPLVRPLAVGSRTDSAAWLGAEVNPRNSSTDYYVEYTLDSDPGYANGSRAPATGTADVGDDNQFVAVTQLVSGLQSGTSYRYRIVASNGAGTTVGPDRTFRTLDELPEPPAGRGYERVSPLDKNGGDIDRNLPEVGWATSGAAAAGNAVAYAAQAQFAGIDSGALQGQYRSVRGSNSWSTRGISPRIDAEPVVYATGPSIWMLSEDLKRAVVTSNAPLTPQASLLGGSWGLYLHDIEGPTASDQLLSVPSNPLSPAVVADRFGFTAASTDLRHIIFDSNGQQLTPDGLENGLYEWADGQVRFVSKLPSGDPVDAIGGAAQGGYGQYFPGSHAVSDDGQRIYFTAGLGIPGPLYVRENGTATKAVSASERAGDDPSVVEPAVFQAAKADDGSLALFTSYKKLTDDATACDAGSCGALSFDLYLWDANAPAGERLTDLTTADSNGSGMFNVVATTPDMSRVYFAAAGALAEGAVAGRPNLYVWSPDDGVRLVAVLDGGDGAVWGTERDSRTAQFRDARLSADGTRLLFASRARLTAHDNAGHKQIYLYDDSTDRLTCVSCTTSDRVSAGDAWFFYPPELDLDAAVQAPRAPLRLPRNLSADGETVFFETDQGLVAGDANGRADVYMWSAEKLSLISTGKGTGPSEFLDASADGQNVFFTTRERLVGVDTDNQVDVYDARVNGGFPEPPPLPACAGDACQPVSPQPTLPELGNGIGAGDPKPAKRASFSVRKVTAGQRRALAKGGGVQLVVTVNKAGRVVAHGTARVGGRAKTVISSSKWAGTSGATRLPLRLSKFGRAQLARSGRLKVSLGVRFTGADESRTLSLGLVAASKQRRGR